MVFLPVSSFGHAGMCSLPPGTLHGAACLWDYMSQDPLLLLLIGPLLQPMGISCSRPPTQLNSLCSSEEREGGEIPRNHDRLCVFPQPVSNISAAACFQQQLDVQGVRHPLQKG